MISRNSAPEGTSSEAVFAEQTSIATSKADLSRRGLFRALLGNREEAPEPEADSPYSGFAPAPPVPADEMRQAVPPEFDPREALDRLRPSQIAQTVRTVLATEIDRRTMLQNMFWGTVAATYAGEAALIHYEAARTGKAMDRLWPENAPSFNYLEGVMPKNPKAIAIFFPGFGDMHSEKEARMVKKDGQVEASVSVGYLDYSNQGASIKEQADAIREKVNLDEVESLTLVCRSMGGPFALGVAKELGVPIKNIIFCASPYEVSDGDYGEAGVAVAKLPPNRAISTVAKDSISFWRRATQTKGKNPFRDFARSFVDLFHTSQGHLDIAENVVDAAHDFKKGLDDLGEALGLAVHDTFSGANPEAARNELRTWDSEHLPTEAKNLDSREKTAYQKVFVPGYTNVLYTATDHPSTDQTVMVRRSAQHFQEFFVDMLGFDPGDFETKNIPYDGHANIEVTMQHLQPWIDANVQPTQKDKDKDKILASGPN